MTNEEPTRPEALLELDAAAYELRNPDGMTGPVIEELAVLIGKLLDSPTVRLDPELRHRAEEIRIELLTLAFRE